MPTLGTHCARCKINAATVKYMIGLERVLQAGSWVPMCQICALEHQLTVTPPSSVALPLIREELRRLKTPVPPPPPGAKR